MKKNNVKWTSMIVAIVMAAFMTACGNNEQEQNTAEDADRMGMADEMDGMDMHQGDEVVATSTEGEPTFVVAYMDIKNALVKDDYEQAKQAASKMLEGLEDSELSAEQRNQLKENAGQIANAQDIEAQRQAFDQLSQQLYQVVKDKDVTEKTLYWQHCPMAMNNRGANWLSYEEQVRNPFMGQKMPGCGSVKENL